MSVLRFRPVTLLMVVLFLSACMTWQPVTVSPQQFLEEEQPRQVRVTRTDSTQVIIWSPIAENDSIGELVAACQSAGGVRTCVRSVMPVISIDDLSGLEVQRTEWGLTIAAILALPVALFVYVAAAAGL